MSYTSLLPPSGELSLGTLCHKEPQTLISPDDRSGRSVYLASIPLFPEQPSQKTPTCLSSVLLRLLSLVSLSFMFKSKSYLDLKIIALVFRYKYTLIQSNNIWDKIAEKPTPWFHHGESHSSTPRGRYVFTGKVDGHRSHPALWEK